ncbi:MAG: methylamine utilization protein [Zymomonas sp.]|nr:methylamine utilization protein [Zymomonas sp.]
MLLLGAAPGGHDLTLQIVDESGRPVEDAVATLKPDNGLPDGAARLPATAVMVQQNIAFGPHVLIVPTGATVQFPNRDKVRHHIYSFSRPARFEMKLYGKDETRSHSFPAIGTVALGCNIHDRMSGFIRVVDTPFAAKSNAGGAIQLRDVPSGNATLVIWHPRAKGRDGELPLRIAMPAAAVSKRITLALR